MSEDQKAGTTLQDDGDEAAQAAAAGTPETADRDAGAEGQEQDEKRTDWKALALTYKGKAERLNEMERRTQELEERLRASEQSPTEAPQTLDDAAAREAQEEYLELVQRAQSGDVLAKRELRRWEVDAVKDRQLADELYLARLRDPDHEAELRKFYKTNRAHFNSIAAADDALAGRKARQASAALAAKEKTADEIINRRDEGIVKTHQRDVSAGEVKARPMTESAWDERIKELEAAGKNDAAFDLRAKRRRGEIVVRG